MRQGNEKNRKYDKSDRYQEMGLIKGNGICEHILHSSAIGMFYPIIREGICKRNKDTFIFL